MWKERPFGRKVSFVSLSVSRKKKKEEKTVLSRLAIATACADRKKKNCRAGQKGQEKGTPFRVLPFQKGRKNRKTKRKKGKKKKNGQ